MKVVDYIVVGSGCSGAMAAQTLVEADAEVLMVDVGMQNPAYHKTVPEKDFLTIRKTEQEQYRYLIGNHAEGVVWGDVGKGAQLTPPRQFITENVEKYLKLNSKTFSPLESLAYGGLGSGWGLQCWEFSDADITAAGLDMAAMPAAYETIGKRIGISASNDIAASHTLVRLKNYQSSPSMDRNHQRVYANYQSRKRSFLREGLYMGRTPLALLTKSMDGRKAYQYRDMDFYDDNDLSAWRPWITVNKLLQQSNFSYLGGHLALRYVEKDGYVEVVCLTVPGNQQVTLRCRKLVLASGALGSGRIALRSHTDPMASVPLLCNPYTFIPCIQPSMVGKAAEPKKLGFGQLSMFYDPTGEDRETSIASLYSYQSLMLFRTIRQIPFLGLSDARKLLQYLVSGIVIMGVQHPDAASSQKTLRLVRDGNSLTGDKAIATYALSAKEEALFAEREKRFISAVRHCGLIATRRIHPGHGSSIHYAGTLPFSNTEKPLALSPEGRLYGTKHVYVADSSGFNFLPARGLTFSLMANAHITAGKVLADV